jgi:hypothetical protein
MNTYNVGGDYWDLRVLVVLWAYRTTRKKFTGQAPFRLVYGKEALMSMEFYPTYLYALQCLLIFHIMV